MPEGSTLLPHHWQQLTSGSGITPEVIAERGYGSIVGAEDIPILKKHGFSREQWSRQIPGLLLPLWTTDGKNGLMVYRPDSPRQNRAGELIKYEIPKHACVRLDCPPRRQPMLDDPSISLWITEGQKKADALASHGCCAVALIGVWNFKGKNAFGASTWLADWDYIALKPRDVRIVFDRDVMTKPPVRQAHNHLTEHLQPKGAYVRAVYLPSENGQKIAADDYLLMHSAQEIEGLIEAPRPQPQAAAPIVEVLDDERPKMARLLMCFDSHAYAATWLPTRTTITEKEVLKIVGLYGAVGAPSGPTDPEVIIRDTAEAQATREGLLTRPLKEMLINLDQNPARVQRVEELMAEIRATYLDHVHEPSPSSSSA
jgi:hypothetical protein